MKIPTNLKHKPVIVSENYENVDGRYSGHSDAKGLSWAWPNGMTAARSISRPKYGGIPARNGPDSRRSLPLHRVLDLAILVCRSMVHFREAYRYQDLYDPENPVIDRIGLQGDAMTVEVCTENDKIKEDIKLFSQALSDDDEIEWRTAADVVGPVEGNGVLIRIKHLCRVRKEEPPWHWISRERKSLASAYQKSFRPMGVYQIRNVKNGKIFVDGTMDLEGAKNRLEFMKQTKMSGIIPEPEAGLGRIRRRLLRVRGTRSDQATGRERRRPYRIEKYRDEVDALLDLWIEKLQPFGDNGYNKPKRTP